jgi:hypothetical protein
VALRASGQVDVYPFSIRATCATGYPRLFLDYVDILG